MSSNPPVCSICIANLLSTESRVTALNCGHIFHLWCITEWLNTKQTCPVCHGRSQRCDLKDLYFSSAYEQQDFWDTRMKELQDDLRLQFDCQTAQMCTFADQTNEKQLKQLLIFVKNELKKLQEEQIDSRETILHYVSSEFALTSIERICLLYIIALLMWPQSFIVLTGLIVFIWFAILKTIHGLQEQLNNYNLILNMRPIASIQA
ncbi:hypothetical protein EDC96DRAFT_493166 [Choanephora cucurbitarum]|nr:hypothetical protein EDC96DRAFT_493166 [Choanephora cucurbitarum]